MNSIKSPDHRVPVSLRALNSAKISAWCAAMNWFTSALFSTTITNLVVESKDWSFPGLPNGARDDLLNQHQE